MKCPASVLAFDEAWIKTLDRATTGESITCGDCSTPPHGTSPRRQKEFKAALRHDRQSTISRGWYLYFLLATGEVEEAVRLAAVNAQDNVTDSQAQAMYGMCLLKAKRYEEARAVYTQALTLGRNCSSAHLGMAQLCQETGQQAQAREHVKRFEGSVATGEYEDLLRRLNLKPPDRSA